MGQRVHLADPCNSAAAEPWPCISLSAQCLRRRRITLAFMLLTVAAMGGLFVIIPKGLFPQQDTGLIVGITEAAQDISPTVIMQRQQSVLAVVRQDPAVASAIGYVGAGEATVAGNNGRMFITLKPPAQRGVTADQVITRLGAALKQVQGMTLYMQAAQDINIGAAVSKTQYQYALTDVDSGELNLLAPKLLQALQALPQLASVTSDQQSTGRTLSLDVDRAAASRFGIDLARVDSTLYDAFGRRHVAKIYTTLNQYYVILEADTEFQGGPNALSRIYVRSQAGTEVPLSQIAKVRSTLAPLAVNHLGQFPSVTINFNLAQRVAIGQAVAEVQKAAGLHLPASLAAKFQGNAQAFQSSLSSTPPLILAALFAVYLILGMLYESTIHPLTILIVACILLFAQKAGSHRTRQGRHP